MIYDITIPPMDNTLLTLIMFLGVVICAMGVFSFLDREIELIPFLHLISIFTVIAVFSSVISFEFIGVAILCSAIGFFLQNRERREV